MLLLLLHDAQLVSSTILRLIVVQGRVESVVASDVTEGLEADRCAAEARLNSPATFRRDLHHVHTRLAGRSQNRSVCSKGRCYPRPQRVSVLVEWRAAQATHAAAGIAVPVVVLAATTAQAEQEIVVVVR